MSEEPLSSASAPAPTLSELIEGFWITQLIGTTVALGIPDTRGDLVGGIEHRAHDATELVGAIGADPTGAYKRFREPARVSALPTSQ